MNRQPSRETLAPDGPPQGKTVDFLRAYILIAFVPAAYINDIFSDVSLTTNRCGGLG